MSRTLAVVALLALLLGGCESPLPSSGFTRDPNIEPLLSEPNIDLVNPVVAPDGDAVFYLRADGASWHGRDLWEGSLYMLRLSKRTPTKLLDGRFSAIALSPDGRTLALSESLLILTDTQGNVLDTVVPPDSETIWIPDVEFTHDGSALVYRADWDYRNWTFYRVNLDGSGKQEVMWSGGSAESSRPGFDLTATDSVYEGSSGVFHLEGWPQFNPGNPEQLVRVGAVFTVRLVTQYRAGGESQSYYCQPYQSSMVYYPHWFPLGDRIAYSAEGPNSGRLELWILNRVGESE